MTRLVAPLFGGFAVGVARSRAAGLLVASLFVRREPMIERQYWLPIALTVNCVVIGFPAFSSMALQLGAPDRASIINGLLPAVKAGFAVTIGKERPGWMFWLIFGFGIVTVLAFAVVHQAGLPAPAAWIGLAYVSLASVFAGFFPWYEGMAMVCVAKISQVQLAQLPLAEWWSTVLLGEPLDKLTIVCGTGMVAFLSRLTQVAR